MSLLTREERRKLSDVERKKLRQERRASKKPDPSIFITKVKNSARRVVTALGGKFDAVTLNAFIDNAIKEVLDLGPAASTEEIVSEVADIVGDKLDTLFAFDTAKIKIGPLTLPVGVVLEKIDGELFDAIAYLVASSLVRARLAEKPVEVVVATPVVETKPVVEAKPAMSSTTPVAKPLTKPPTP